MKEKPILFSGPMVRAILDGRKTMTRRIMKTDKHPEYTVLTDTKAGPHQAVFIDPANPVRGLLCVRTASYEPGDVLWVREATIVIPTGPTLVGYVADGCKVTERYERQRPSIHMARSHCRLRLRVTGVKAERVQDISEDDAIAEGMDIKTCAAVFEGASKVKPALACYVRYDDGSESEGWHCYECALRLPGKKNGTVAGDDCPESDGPAYCDKCFKPLQMSLTKYGIDRELFLQGDTAEDVKHYAATGTDAAIAGMIADGIGDLQEHHKPRLAKIAFATLWNSINGPGSWGANPWVWCYTFEVIK